MSAVVGFKDVQIIITETVSMSKRNLWNRRQNPSELAGD
jgi:hypothetical protein